MSDEVGRHRAQALVERLTNAADAADIGAWTRPGVTVEPFGPLLREAAAALAAAEARQTEEPSDFEALMEHHRATEADNASLKQRANAAEARAATLDRLRREDADSHMRESLQDAEAIRLWKARTVQAEADRDRLRAALEQVEWVYAPDPHCPWCNEDERLGHKSDCPRQAALGG